MIGYYLLSTSLLKLINTIKFGMSMRLEYRWIDYYSVFNDPKYEYYYEILNDLSRNEILYIENQIIKLFEHQRNYTLQTEYFYCTSKEEFHEIIINELNKYNIKYIVHTKHNFIKDNYDNKPDEPYCLPENILPKKPIIKLENIQPQPHQITVLDMIESFYIKNNIGKLSWCCGLGKTLLSIFIVKKLLCNLVIIGVPSIYLQNQYKNEILRIFPDKENILNIGSNGTTDIKTIKKFIRMTNPTITNPTITNHTLTKCKFIITTFTSCHLLTNINNIDFKIGDEAHHLSNINNTFNEFHKIKSNKTLFMTATEKHIISKLNSYYSMDDEKVFGKYIDIKTVTWAIENNKITDYNLLILKNNESEINNIISNLKNNIIIENKELFLAAYMTLKSIIQYSKLKHVLIYTNTTNSADLVENYIEIIIQSKIIDIGNNYYNKSLHSGNTNNINSEIKKFINSPIGIISSVYIFGEGFDCPSLYGVVFAENMDSEIRIVQCALRPNRLEKPNKKAYIIIPYIDTDNFITDNNSFDKCRKIIAKIRNVDEHIECKIKVKTINNNKIIKNNETNIHLIDTTNDYIDNPNELNKIILRLRYSKALYSNFSEEQDEFNYIKQLNKELNIKSKIEYSNINLNHPNYIINPEEYFRTKGVWTNWYDFLGYNTINFIQSKNEWIEFCKNNNVKTLNDYDNLCNQYEKLPRNPSDFYKNFTNIIKELNLDKLRR